ncbi:leucine-rich repeat-containing protein, partial [Tanacetum coccineum]
ITTASSHGQQLGAARGAATKCIYKERQALLDFKASLEDPNGRLSTWRVEDEDCCHWRGVVCDNALGHVTGLDLAYNNLSRTSLTGETVSPSLLNLTCLNYLNLYNNSFHGTIPKFIGSMTQLTYLNLGQNQFTGTIPEFIGNMTQLTDLNLGFNNFGGNILESFSYLAKLKNLVLSENSLHGTIPHGFANLTNLQKLALDGISLAKADNWVNTIIGLKKLSFLSLIGCDLSQVMQPYFPSVNSSSSIVTLHLDNNNLNVSMYRWLCPLISNRLQHLSLIHNKLNWKLSDFLKKLSGCGSVELLFLDATGNQFTGSLSDEIQNFTSLTHLNLAFNNLNGTISDKLWELPRLQELNLSSNFLRGVISEKIGKSHLFKIDLSNNSLEGVPWNADMSNLSKNLKYLDFSSCKLGPHFPKWILRMKNLFHLDLSNNSISDTISIEYWNQWRLSGLLYLNLSFNNISGKLPNFLSNFSVLHSMDLSSNNFYGPVPAFPADIYFISLSRNKFHGGLSCLCHMYEALEFLDLGRNSFTGNLPDCLWNLEKVTVFVLGHNMLSGTLPPSLGCLGQLVTLCLYDNNFSGELPLSFKNCTKLNFLDIGSNKFFGNIPIWIGENLSGLYFLSLRSNKFFGTIPLQLCRLVTLQILDLSVNSLYGTIPSCVNNLTTMVQKGFFVKQTAHHYPWSFHDRAGSRGGGYKYVDRVDNSYVDRAMIEWQGKINEFSNTLKLLKTIDLSSNNLTGPIPYELTNLHGLVILDLSLNALTGEIPQDIGQMTELLTLNLSRNFFSGKMPSSMSKMDSLNDIDVSYNNMSGRVPSSTQLQSFEPARFKGNKGLCGPPVTKSCSEDEELEASPTNGESDGDGDDNDELWNWFYIGGGTGFATSFWIACIALFLNRDLRHAFYHLQDSLKSWVCMKMQVINLNQWHTLEKKGLRLRKAPATFLLTATCWHSISTAGTSLGSSADFGCKDFLLRGMSQQHKTRVSLNSGDFDQGVLASPVWALARIGTFMGRLSTQSISLPIGRQYNKRESLRMGPLTDARGRINMGEGGLRAFKNQWKGKTCSLFNGKGLAF